ncbi:quercetin dioxygenase-like cupin family protein [Fontibacillus solani]|uniref:Quercetin dioxygenase-like cupin family protein n=1 Tax=Fontibacillus solani TaxID=1572857 RepID=A0A7W3XT13_9BACL|nr:cupin domain-containing protein [Fontibacillus solani]MBA9087141.1 quercetin dioxygenase-like cupin family protein [Fontibacillus solani]
MNEITTGSVFYLKDLVNVRAGRITSRNLLLPVTPTFAAIGQKWVLYALDQQETISSETSPGTKFIYVLEGELHMMVSQQHCHLTAGASIIVPPNTWHDFTAKDSCKFLQITE